MAWLRLRFRATAEEDRRGDGVATGVLGPGPATTAAVGASLSLECALFSAASLISLAELAAEVDSDSLILGSRLAAFLLAAFFLAGDLEWHRTQSHLPRGTYKINTFKSIRIKEFLIAIKSFFRTLASGGWRHSM